MPFCHNCGTALEAGDKFCPQCGTKTRMGAAESMSRPLEQPVPNPVEKQADQPSSQKMDLIYKGVGIRFAAQIADTMVVLIFYVIAGKIISGIFGGATEEGFKLAGGPALLLIGLTTIFWIAYFTILEAFWNGQTLGKKLTGIKVVREDGGPIDLSASIVRNLLRVVDGFACYLVAAILVWTSPIKQRLGDRVAHTVVVKKS